MFYEGRQIGSYTLLSKLLPAKPRTPTVSISNLMENKMESKYLIAIAVGVLVVTIIIFAIGYSKRNTIIPSSPNSSPNLVSTVGMNIELKTSGERVFLLQVLTESLRLSIYRRIRSKTLLLKKAWNSVIVKALTIKFS